MKIKKTALSKGKIKLMADMGAGAWLICVCHQAEESRYRSLLESIKKMPTGTAIPVGGDSQLSGKATNVESIKDSNPSPSFPTMTMVKEMARKQTTPSVGVPLMEMQGV